MGREANLKILIPYIETALKIGAVDNYWFIDMTRKRSDHELIKKLSAELNDKYPGRVHLYNSEERGRIIDDKDKLAEATKSWETFYKFLRRFNDNDIIAKCDDDTYFIDVETLKAAYEFRWNNKKPYLMHANCINNGLTAYHANKKGVWKDKESSMYPIGGLTGPLFSHPDIACKHHEQFTRDMLANHDNINKYKLDKNIQFCNRVSINFIFMLGKDRHELSKITYQDEYDTSCKYPQRENRPNVIIGDFTIVHHTYGVQEPMMEKLKTHIGYEKLCEQLNNDDVSLENKTIGTDLNATTTIASKGKMLSRAWVENNSFALKDPNTNKYVTFSTKIINQKAGDVVQTIFDRSDHVKDACIFNLDIDRVSNIYMHNSTKLLRTPVDTNLPAQLAVPTPGFFQSSYLKSKVKVEKKPNGKYVIRDSNHNEYVLSPGEANLNLQKNNPEAYKKLINSVYFSKKGETPFEWELVPLRKFVNDVVPMSIKRPKNFNAVANDETIGTSNVEGLPNNNVSREWIWMVKDYVWEMIPTPKENIFKIKLVADDKPGMYLFYNQGQDKLITGTGGDEFEFVDKAPKYLKHVKTGKYVNVTDDGQVVLQSNFAELAMCPQR
jgi:hypothetical protein